MGFQMITLLILMKCFERPLERHDGVVKDLHAPFPNIAFVNPGHPDQNMTWPGLGKLAGKMPKENFPGKAMDIIS